MTVSADRFTAALERIDAENRADPHRETCDGRQEPAEWLYGRRMSECLEWFAPGASVALRLAARAQHSRRWEIPRSLYPRNRQGYHLWRTRLYGHHADVAERVLREVGYDEATIQRVRELLMKKGLRSDPEMQTLEDVICLVFLQYYLADFAAPHERGKVITILQRTWRKMTARGREAALRLDLPAGARDLVEEALGRG